VLGTLGALGVLSSLSSRRPRNGLRLPRLALMACLRVVAGCFKGVSWEGLCGGRGYTFKRARRAGVRAGVKAVRLAQREASASRTHKKVRVLAKILRNRGP
jgi:hypothetical protein